jgi:hypothetical protein
MSTVLSTLSSADLQKAYEGSYYFIAGAGGDLDEWVTGYNGLLAEEGIGEPKAWFKTTGASVNLYAGPSLECRDYFQEDLVILLFPLDGLDGGKLALFKLRAQDRWFDDVIDNMRRIG